MELLSTTLKDRGFLTQMGDHFKMSAIHPSRGATSRIRHRMSSIRRVWPPRLWEVAADFGYYG
jgi:hypothetical protein